MLDAQLYGQHAAGFHLTNLLLHVGSALLLFAVLRRMTGALWPSLLAAALFAVHPLNVEPVAWVSERKGVLSTFFWMLTLWAYAWYAERPGWMRYLLVVLGLGLGLAAKPMLVTLPFTLLLLDYWPLRRLRWATPPSAAGAGAAPAPAGRAAASLRWLVYEKVPLFGLVAVFSVVAMVAQHMSGAIPPLSACPLETRLENVPFSYLWYLRQAAYPSNLGAFHPFVGMSHPALWAAAAGLLLVAATLLCLWRARQVPYLVVGWLWYLGTLLPVSGLVQIGSHARADRYAYVPMVGIFVACAWGVAELARRWHARQWAFVPAVLAGAYFALTSWTQAHTWHDSGTLWEHTLDSLGESAVAHTNLGVFLKQQGKGEAAVSHFESALRVDPHFAPAHYELGRALTERGRVEEAIPHLRQAVHCHPEEPGGHNDLGLALTRHGELTEAVQQLRLALDLQPDSANVRYNSGQAQVIAGIHNNLGLALLLQGTTRDAVEQFRAALHTHPDFAPAQFNLGLSFSLGAEWEESITCFRAAIHMQPGNARYHRALAHALHQRGRTEEARNEYQESLRLDPDWPEHALELSWRLATSPNPGRRNGNMAVMEAEQVQQAAAQTGPRLLDVLAAAYAESGRFEDAAATAREAVVQATVAGQPGLSGQIEGRLRLYQMRQPYHTASP
jgi:tetratricopeptide (TPR) repeat protein